MQYQTATISDIPPLATLRWQFRKEDGEIVSHIYIQIIEKVSKPPALTVTP